jgi:hypothetical protein
VLQQAITATTLSGTATCPVGGPLTAATVVTNLSVFGTSVAAGANATVTTDVTVPGVTGAQLTATVITGIENVGATTATATALSISFTLTGTAAVGGGAINTDLGTLIAGNATCVAPAEPPAPTATGLDPNQGPTAGNTTVTVTGTGFVEGQTSITIGGIAVPAADVTVTSPTTLTFVTPAHPAGDVTVTVTTPTGTSGPLGFTYLPPAPAPTATGLDPNQGPTAGGTVLTVRGSDFVPGQTFVTIGGITVPASDVTVVSPTELTFVTPAHQAANVELTVTTPGGTSDSLIYTYLEFLAATGSPAGPMTRLGLLLLITGCALVMFSRRLVAAHHRG